MQDLESQQGAQVVQGGSDVQQDEERRQALRQAGAVYFERALQASSRGEDPFDAPSAAATKQQDVTDDPDLKAFGRVLNVSKKYIYMVLYTGCLAFSPVLIKSSLYSLQAPAVLLFFHMLGTVLLLWFASWWDIFTLHPVTAQALKGCAIPAALWALQSLCVFSTLHHNSVNFVLCWSLVGREAVAAAANAISAGKPVNRDVRVVLMLSAAAAGVEFILDTDKVWLGFLMMAVWTVLVVAEAAWKQLKVDPQAGGYITNFRTLGLLRELSEEEDAISPPDVAFLKHAVTCVPILLLGFVALEGRELVNHELSVPAVTVMLLAISCHMVATACDLLLEGRIEAKTKLLLQTIATLTTMVLYFMEEMRTISWAACLFTAISCCSSLLAGMLKRS